jgi:hypothetical protein
VSFVTPERFSARRIELMPVALFLSPACAPRGEDGFSLGGFRGFRLSLLG